MSSVSDGKTQWSPEYVATSAGSVMSGPVRSIVARDDSPDHVESQASGDTIRPNPTAP